MPTPGGLTHWMKALVNAGDFEFGELKTECCSRSTLLAGEHLWQNTLLLIAAASTSRMIY